MGSIERRLRALEDDRNHEAVSLSRELSREALRHLSDEDLDALEDVLEAGQGDGTATFEDLYRVVGERGRRSLEAYYEAFEAVRRGEEPPTRDPPAYDTHDPGREERLEAEAEEMRREWERRDGYRIWRHYGK